jgi:hypothetical protein
MTVNHIHTVITDSGVTEFVDADELDYVAEWIKNYSTELKLYDQRRVRMIPYSGTCPTYTIVDECHETKGHELDGPKNIYWHQPIPSRSSNKPASDPSQAKRTKLRAKRKKR